MSHTYSVVKEGVLHTWNVEKLWEYSKDLEASEWEIPSDFLESWSWGQTHISQHIDRCLSADLSYPILVYEGKIIDGCHRAVKAMAQGDTHISAKLLTELPTPDDIGDATYAPSVGWDCGDLVKVIRAFFEYEKRVEYGFRHPIDGI